MGVLPLLSAIGFPLLMAVGGIYAWRSAKKESKPEASKALWRDTSLDDWRTDREAAINEERSGRLENASSGVHEGGAGGERPEAVRHQRIGG